MSDQHSQKTGTKSEAQKLTRAREGYEPLPASQPVAGAFGNQQPKRQTDQDLAISKNEPERNQQNS